MTVDDDYINRFIHTWGYYTSFAKTRADATAALSPYVQEKLEDIYLKVLQVLLEGLPDQVQDIDKFMRQGYGNYQLMFESLRIHILEEERVVAAAAALVIQSSNDIATTGALVVPTAITTTSEIVPDDQSINTMCSVQFEDIEKTPLAENEDEIKKADDDDDDIEDHAHTSELAAYDKHKEHLQNRGKADDEKEISEKITSKDKKRSRITRSSMVIDD